MHSVSPLVFLGKEPQQRVWLRWVKVKSMKSKLSIRKSCSAVWNVFVLGKAIRKGTPRYCLSLSIFPLLESISLPPERKKRQTKNTRTYKYIFTVEHYSLSKRNVYKCMWWMTFKNRLNERNQGPVTQLNVLSCHHPSLLTRVQAWDPHSEKGALPPTKQASDFHMCTKVLICSRHIYIHKNKSIYLLKS